LQNSKFKKMEKLYPIKFKPILKERLWGGDKLLAQLGKKGTCKNCGESWEISAIQGDISVVENGFLKNNTLEEIIEIYMADLVGEKVYARYGIEFPLLIKFIDAQDDLSIQVHPDDQLAKERHSSYGKTEMWYIMEAGPQAKLISGFNRSISKDEYLDHLNNKTLPQIMNFVPAAPGDSFFIPAGRVHAIGTGILLAEIQQTSDITYRIYDWDRVDSKGNPRELHTELALDAIDFSYVKDVKNTSAKTTNGSDNLAKCAYFTTDKISFNAVIERDYFALDSFVIYICCHGKFDIVYHDTEKLEVKAGDTILIPASLGYLYLQPTGQVELLEVYID
jgi:mannose-6-phosphate isomerase